MKRILSLITFAILTLLIGGCHKHVTAGIEPAVQVQVAETKSGAGQIYWARILVLDFDNPNAPKAFMLSEDRSGWWREGLLVHGKKTTGDTGWIFEVDSVDPGHQVAWFGVNSKERAIVAYNDIGQNICGGLYGFSATANAKIVVGDEHQGQAHGHVYLLSNNPERCNFH